MDIFEIKKIGHIPNNTIVNADCLEAMKYIPDKSIDLVIIDPPYLIKGNGFNAKAGFLKDRNIFQDIKDIKDGFDFNILFELRRILKKWNCYIYCNKELLFELICWFKTNEPNCFLDVLVEAITNPTPFCNTYLNNLDYILFIRENGVSINGNIKDKTKYRIKSTNKVDKDKYKHPTPKYVHILQEYIKNSSKEGDLVLDCFSGSGSLAVAAYNTHRNFICIEKNKEYYNKSVERYNNTKMQLKLF